MRRVDGDDRAKTGLRRADELLRGVLRATRVVDHGIAGAVTAAARTFWPEAGPEEVRAGQFRRGVLHVIVNSHARMAEAKNFLGDAFRHEVNRLLAQDRRSGSRLPPHVARLVFHVAGTY